MVRPEAPGKDTKRQRHAHAFPPILHVELTNECNLECPMCARTTSMTRPVQHMDADLFRRIVDDVAGRGVQKLWLHHFGESLLHPQAYDLITYAARKRDLGLVALSTNATTLNEANARKLIKTRLHHLILSVDAHSDDVYKVVRGFDFERVLNNVRGFLALHKEMESKMSVALLFINMGIKRHELEAFKEAWAPYETKRVKVVIKKMTNYGGVIDTAQFTGGQSDTEVYDRSRRRSCPKLWDSLTVQSNGQVVACGYDVNGTMPYGNAGDMTLLEAWNGGAIDDLRERHVALNFDGLPLCDGCDKTFKKRRSAPDDDLI